MPTMKLKDSVAQFIVISPSTTQDEEVKFILGPCAPDDFAQQAQDWYAANPGTSAKDVALWMQGKNWGVLANYEVVSLHRRRKKA